MERANGASGSSSQHEPEQASKHADQIPDLNGRLLIPIHLLDHPWWHISVPFLDCTNCSISLSSSCTYPSAVLATHCTQASLLGILESSTSIPVRSIGWRLGPSNPASAAFPTLCFMRSGAFHVCCQCDHPLSLAIMRASRELSTPDLQPRPPVTGYHGRLSVPVKKTSSGLQSSATWTSNSGDLISDNDEIVNRDHFVEEYNRLAKKVCTPISSHVFRLADSTAAWRASTGPRPARNC